MISTFQFEEEQLNVENHAKSAYERGSRYSFSREFEGIDLSTSTPGKKEAEQSKNKPQYPMCSRS